MKKLNVTDFKTPFAQVMSKHLGMQIDWEFFTEFQRTNILNVGIKAKFNNAVRDGLPITRLDEDKLYTLSNGRNVTGEVINRFISMKNHYDILKCFQILENTFENTVDIGTLLAFLTNDDPPPSHDVNFVVALQCFPAEATHIFVQMHFLRQAVAPLFYNNIFVAVANNLNGENIPSGMLMPPMDLQALSEYIDLNWLHLVDIVDTEVIPTTKMALETYGDEGPLFH